MADTTISGLTLATPTPSFLLPCSDGSATYASCVSSMFLNMGNKYINVLGNSNEFNTGTGLVLRNAYSGHGFTSIYFGNDASFNAGAVWQGSSNYTYYAGPSSMNIGTLYDAPMGLVTGNAVRMYVAGNGNVGIGTTTPLCRLDLVASGTVLRIAAGGGTDNNQGGQFVMSNINPDVPNPRKYHRVNYNGSYEVVNSDYASTIFKLTDAGAAYQGNNSASWSTISDIKLKENIRPISCALEKISGLKPCHFEYKNQLGKTRTGFVAQEFENVFPGHVTNTNVSMQFESVVDKSEQIKTIDMDLIPYLTKAIQELLLRIEKIEERLKY